MIIADTSVWIDYFNGAPTKYADALDLNLADGIVAIGDLIYLEILQGFKNDKQYKQAKSALSTLDCYNLLDFRLAEKGVENYRSLRKRGITIRKTNDVIIATFCIENDLPLLFSDKDFLPFVDELGLKSVTQN